MACAKIATSKDSDERRATRIQQSASGRPLVSMAFPIAPSDARGTERAEVFTGWWFANLVRLTLVNIGH
jgi:hypothetical protein